MERTMKDILFVLNKNTLVLKGNNQIEEHSVV